MSTPHARSVVSSPLGDLTLEASASGLCAILWGDRGRTPAPPPAERRHLERAEKELQEYFAGRRRAFSVPLDLKGTAFQRAVWKRLLEIPFGQTVSYSDVARAIRRPRACRAVGGANRRNPVPIIVPCHRVIGASGDLVGYGGRSGLPLKRRLLQLESA